MSRRPRKFSRFFKSPTRVVVPRPLFLVPIAVAVCAFVVVATPHMLAHTKNSPVQLQTTSEAAASVDPTQAQAGAPKAVIDTGNTPSASQPTESGTSSSPASNKAGQAVAPSTTSPSTSSGPASTGGSQPTVAATPTDCPSLVKSLTATLNGTVGAAQQLLSHNLSMFGLDLTNQNKSIDSYNNNIAAVYNASVKSAKDAGCTFDVAAPAKVSHKSRL